MHHYADYSLTVAKHPSETSLRMMYRLVAFGLLCQEEPEFTRGLSSDEEPDLWKIHYDGTIDHWIELGHLDERRIRQVCSKAKQVSLFTYQGTTSITWFNTIKDSLSRFSHLNVTHLTVLDGQDIESLVERGMNFTMTIEDGELWLSSEESRIHLKYDKVYQVQERK